jgi:uncharacterized protein with HEPN domain
VSSKPDPAGNLSDIIENAERIAQYLTSTNYDDFTSNFLLRDAVERCMERVCEAAHRLGNRATELMPHQPWNDIRGMGNRLRHAYDRIDVALVWQSAFRDIPALAADARRALEALTEKNDDLTQDV